MAMAIYRAWAVTVVLLLVSVGEARDPNLQTDDPNGSGQDFDSRGCDKSTGSYWCEVKSKCVTTWEHCELLYGYNEQCTAQWSGLSWDLSALQGKVFTITDTLESGPSYAYAFSLCGNADLAQSGFTSAVAAKCASTTGAAGEVTSHGAPAYQVYDGAYCKRVGGDQSGSNKERFARGDQMEWALLDPLNPAMGLELTYTGGNTCKASQYQDSKVCNVRGDDGVTYCSRGMKIRMVCNPDVEYVPVFTSVEEDASCNYEVRINSKYACPQQCPWGENNKPCSGKGLCMFSGYSGDGQGTAAEGSATAACACQAGISSTTADCGTYSRWGATYTDSYDYLAQRSFFWKKVWGFLFFCVFFATCVVQRRRVVPLYTGLVSLYHGQSAFDAAHGAGPYQRVATSSEGASCKGAAPLQKPLAPAARATAVAKYTIGDMEDDNEDEAGFSAEL